MNKDFKSFVEETARGIEHALNGGVKEYSFCINCADLDNYLITDIRSTTKFELLFKQLGQIENQAIYWYEIVSDTNNSSILEAFEQYKQNPTSRPTPALNNYEHQTSKTLYVGKVKGCLWGRTIQHLGYHKDATDHGLQLYHWAKPLSLKLELHVIEVNDNMNHLIPSLEVYFANKLQPLIGKHTN